MRIGPEWRTVWKFAFRWLTPLSYVLWRRLLHVCTLLMKGETLCTAAHLAGFADSAHLSRTARTMFGLPPSVLQMNGPLSARAREQRHLPEPPAL